MRIETRIFAQIVLLIALAFVAVHSEVSQESSSCNSPAPISNVFNIPGLQGWELISQEDYLTNIDSIYASSAKCSWFIRRPDEYSILLIKIARLKLEYGARCQYDSLQLDYMNYSSNANVNTSYCGTVANKFVLANSDATIRFKTDGSMDLGGFQLQWAFVNQSLAMRIQGLSTTPIGQSDRCSKPDDLRQLTLSGISAPGGRLVSHDYFGDATNYPSNMNCQWTVTSPTGYILLWIEQLQLEFSGTAWIVCEYDNLTLSFFDIVSGGPQKLTLCRSTYIEKYLSNTSITIKFMSDSDVESNGFMIKWMYVNESQALAAKRILSSRENEDLRCTEPDNLQEVTIGNITGPGGQLQSHDNYDNIMYKYDKNLNCQWTVTSPTGYILLIIEEVKLERDVEEQGVCDFDRLTLSFFNLLTGKFENSTFCKSYEVKLLSNTSISMNFITNGLFAYKGFRVKWTYLSESTALRLLRTVEASTPARATSAPLKSSSCTAPAPATNLFNVGLKGWQLLSHENYLSDSTSEYSNNMNCSWSIRRPDRDSIVLIKIVALKLESPTCPLDSLRLQYFNYSTNSSVAVGYCDEEVANKVLLMKSDVSISFKTDGTRSSRGFHLQWTFIYESLYSRDPTLSQCATVETMDDGSRRIAERLPSKTEKQCRWTIQPQRRTAVIRFRVRKFRVATPNRTVASDPIKDCRQTLTMKTNNSIDVSSAEKIATSIVSMLTASGDRSSLTSAIERELCSQRYSETNGTAGDLFSLVSAGPLEINLRTTPYSRSVDYEFVIEEINVIATSAGRKTEK